MSKRNVVDELMPRAESLSTFESRLLNLLALQLVQGKAQVEQIVLLSKVGLRPIEIAGLLGTTPNTVSVLLSKEKRERKAKKR